MTRQVAATGHKIHRAGSGLRAGLASLVLALVLLRVLAWGTAGAQSPDTYTVQPGDTLGAIATRFGVDLVELAAANGIDDVNRIDVGQVLVIPGHTPRTAAVVSRPGDTLEDVAARVAIPAAQLAALNGLEPSARLFPGQPIHLPPGASPGSRLRFGAVVDVALPAQIVQGHSGRLTVTSTRPLSLTARWNGVPLGIRPAAEEGDRFLAFAYVPTPALMGPGDFPLVIAYTARNGVVVSHTFDVPVVAGDYISQQILLPDDKGALLDPELLQKELERLWGVWSRFDTPIQWRRPFSRPVGLEYPTTSPYGTRRSYNGGPYNTFHGGQDFGVPAGVTVTAPADGIVALAETLTVRGNGVILDHGQGVYTNYWHLRALLVTPGQRVRAGEPLGVVGTTGLSTGAHLHWELRIYGVAVDPMQFLEEPLFPPVAVRR